MRCADPACTPAKSARSALLHIGPARAPPIQAPLDRLAPPCTCLVPVPPCPPFTSRCCAPGKVPLIQVKSRAAKSVSPMQSADFPLRGGHRACAQRREQGRCHEQCRIQTVPPISPPPFTAGGSGLCPGGPCPGGPCPAHTVRLPPRKATLTGMPASSLAATRRILLVSPMLEMARSISLEDRLGL